MTGATAFLRKEFHEILRTYKIYVIPSIFLLMGFLSPLVAKFTPEIVKSMAPKMEGLRIELPTPTAIDAYTQLLKNYNQIVLLAVIFSLIGLVAEEKVRGSAALILTKPVPRRSFVAAKYLASAVLILVSTALSYLACLYYTVIIFKKSLFAASAQAVFLVYLYYLLILAVTLFASTVSRSVALAGALSVGGYLVLSLLPSLHPWLGHYSPGALVGYQGKLIAGAATWRDAWPAAASTLGLAAVLFVLSIFVFERQEL